MEAKEGRLYALIQAGIVHTIFTIADLPEWNDSLIVVDISDVTPKPDVLWTAEFTNDVWVFSPPPAPPEIVYSCTPWQIRKALNAAGLRQQIEDAVSGSSDQNLKDGWEFATEFRSDDSFVLSMGAALGKSQADTAALIQQASLL